MDDHERSGLVAAGIVAALLAAVALAFAGRRARATAPSWLSRPAATSEPPDLSDRPVPRSVAAQQAPAPHPE
jgi:hypothetical protein